MQTLYTLMSELGARGLSRVTGPRRRFPSRRGAPLFVTREVADCGKGVS
jgi:hypothetical protein